MHHPRDMATYPAGIDLTLERVFLRQALAGRDDAFVLLGSMYSEQVYAIARNLCSTDGEALELTRNAFQRARAELDPSSAVVSDFRVSIPCQRGSQAAAIQGSAGVCLARAISSRIRGWQAGVTVNCAARRSMDWLTAGTCPSASANDSQVSGPKIASLSCCGLSRSFRSTKSHRSWKYPHRWCASAQIGAACC